MKTGKFIFKLLIGILIFSTFVIAQSSTNSNANFRPDALLEKEGQPPCTPIPPLENNLEIIYQQEAYLFNDENNVTPPEGWKHADEPGCMQTQNVPEGWIHYPVGYLSSYYIPPNWNHVDVRRHRFYPATSYYPPGWTHNDIPTKYGSSTSYHSPSQMHISDPDATQYTSYKPNYFVHNDYPSNHGPNFLTEKTLYYNPYTQKHATLGPEATAIIPSFYQHVSSGEDMTQYIAQLFHIPSGPDASYKTPAPARHQNFPEGENTKYVHPSYIHVDNGPIETAYVPPTNIHADEPGLYYTYYLPPIFIHDTTPGPTQSNYYNPLDPDPGSP